ncbi:MAG: CinA family nicotinamide mononucleotide deamidase-related protein [bacterium]|nr:MAG: CinA family nicotinamide mononucleotide deamidase-related protein [bacterium]
MKVEIISIGDEILIGQIVNTNATYIAQKLTELGFDVDWITVVGDNTDRLFKTIELAEQRADIVIATGGLGPTHDDITKKVFAKYFNARLVLNEQILNKIRERFSRRRIRMAKTNKEQAMVPDNAILIENKVGTAAGFLFQKGEKYFFVLPGVPAEMISMIESSIIPYLKNKIDKVFKKRILHTTGIPESTLFEKLGDIEPLEKLAKIAFLPTYSGVNIRITVQGPNETFCQQRINQIEKVFREKFDQFIWGTDDDTIESIVARLLVTHNKTISIIEFGTYGNLIAQLTNVVDVEKFFIQGLTIGSVDTLKKFLDYSMHRSGVEDIVTTKICKELAVKIKQLSGSDIALAIMHCDKLDVTTYIAICDAHQISSQRYIFTFHPSMNIQRITMMALKLLYQHLTKEKIS